MVGVFALRADAVEIAERLVVIAVGEFDIAHANVVLLLARPAESFVIGLFKSLAGAFLYRPRRNSRSPARTARRWHRPIRGNALRSRRSAASRRGCPTRRHSRQIEVDRLRRLAVGGRKRLPRLQELMPGAVQRPKSNSDLPRSIKAADSGVPACAPGAHNAHTAKASNKFRFFRIRHLDSYKGQIYENLPFSHIGKRNICRCRILRKPPLLHLSKIIPTLRRH